MSDHFYINCAGATQPLGIGSRFQSEPPRERVDALLPLLRKLLESESDPGEKHICPVCGEAAKISFEYYLEIPSELDIAFECRTCSICVFFKSNKVPAWARAVSLSELPGFID